MVQSGRQTEYLRTEDCCMSQKFNSVIKVVISPFLGSETLPSMSSALEGAKPLSIDVFHQKVMTSSKVTQIIL